VGLQAELQRALVCVDVDHVEGRVDGPQLLLGRTLPGIESDCLDGEVDRVA
jgi:hypothetical protein